MFGRIKGAIDQVPTALLDMAAAVKEFTAELRAFTAYLREKRGAVEGSPTKRKRPAKKSAAETK